MTRAGAGALVVLTALLGACSYGFQGGGGFPAHVNTLYIAPLDVEPSVTRVDLRQDLYTLLLDRVPSSLGVQSAGEGIADAVLRVTLSRYDDVAQNYRSNNTGRAIDVLENQVEIVVKAEIVDVTQNLILWEGRSIMGKGAYLRDSESEREGQLRAMENVVQLIVDGAQSQW